MTFRPTQENLYLKQKNESESDLTLIPPITALPFRCTRKTNWVRGRASSLLTLSVLLLRLVVLLLCVCGFSFALQQSLEKAISELHSSLLLQHFKQGLLGSHMLGRYLTLLSTSRFSDNAIYTVI